VNTIISTLVHQFESGSLTRRQLIAALAVMVTPMTERAAAAEPIQTAGINHVSLSVTDLERSVDFYVKTFDGVIVFRDKESVRVKFGATGNDHVALRVGTPASRVDHFAMGVLGFNKDAVTQSLKDRGAPPSDSKEFGFHVNDPDGFPVQLVGVQAV
jgi:catechol 2,3-dioxygenase-like lactoylglutathione lyase family enzyme